MTLTDRDYVLASRHAVEMFRRRCPEGADWTHEKIIAGLVWAANNGTPFGVQLGSDTMVQSDAADFSPVVLVVRETKERCKRGGRLFVIVTVLTIDQAQANMQASVRQHGYRAARV